jgi:hypothetical protein
MTPMTVSNATKTATQTNTADALPAASPTRNNRHLWSDTFWVSGALTNAARPSCKRRRGLVGCSLEAP